MFYVFDPTSSHCSWPLVLFFFHCFNLKQQEAKWAWPPKPLHLVPCDQIWDQHPWAHGARKCPLCRKSQVWGAPNATREHLMRMLSFVWCFLFQVHSYLHLHQPKQLPKLDGAWALWLFFILLMCPSNAGQPAWHFDWDFKSLLLPIPLFHFSPSNTG